MIGLFAVSAVLLAGLQAGIDRPRNAFNSCLTATSAKAMTEKVAGDAYQAYLESACSAQISAFKTATINFDVKNRIAPQAGDGGCRGDDRRLGAEQHRQLQGQGGARKSGAWVAGAIYTASRASR